MFVCHTKSDSVFLAPQCLSYRAHTGNSRKTEVKSLLNIILLFGVCSVLLAINSTFTVCFLYLAN